MTNQLKTFLKAEGIKNIDNTMFKFSDTEVEILTSLLALTEGYGEELHYIKSKNMSSFNLAELPEVIADSVRLATHKTPSFSNIAALSIVNYTLADVLGQLRCTMNDGVYSSESLGINYYSITLSKSGAGKDSTYKALLSAFQPASDYIHAVKLEESTAKAREQYIRMQQRENPDFDSTSVTLTDYELLIKDPESTVINLSSTRGGITSSLNRMEQASLGTKSIFASELSQVMSTSPFIAEVFELVSVLFDMGASDSPEFKTEESKEKSIEAMFINFLGISSPTLFYTDQAIKNKLVPMLSTAFARRLFFISPDSTEDYENLVVPKTPAEDRLINANNRIKYREYSDKVSDKILTAVMGAMEDKTVIFDDEASDLYDSYKSYTQKKANIISIAFPKSILAIEMAGRSFKMARIAALWALAQNKRTIDKATLDAAIYFAEYTANHFQRFEKMISLKPYELLANDYMEGILHNTLPIDKAITSGYIVSTSKSSIMSFLEPLNSYLKGTATVNYSDKENAFIFTPVKKNVSTGDYCYSASPISIGQLRSSVNGFTHIKPVAELALINALTSLDSVYSPFATADETKFIVLDISSSELSMEVLHEYMKPYYHIISTQEDIDDNHTYTVILPINETISKKEYRYVVNSIAVNFMLRPTPEQIDSEAIYNTYKEAHILSSTENPMATFDVSEIKARYASKKSQPVLSTKLPLTTVQAKKKLSEALEHEEMMVDHIDNSDNPLLAFAQVARSLHIDCIEPTTLLDIVDSINSLIEEPISEPKKLKYLINPFKGI